MCDWITPLPADALLARGMMGDGHIDFATITDPFTKQLSELQAGADVFRFDGSDQMPGAVGAGTFWTEITKWIVGGSTDDFVNNVEASWPKS